MAKTTRVPVPRSTGQLLELAQAIYQKHQTDGPASPLKTLTDFNWDLIGPNIGPALAKNNEAEMLRRQMEKCYEERDHLMGDIDSVVRVSRDLLKAVNKKNPRKLGDWGFDVNDTSTAKSNGEPTP